MRLSLLLALVLLGACAHHPDETKDPNYYKGPYAPMSDPTTLQVTPGMGINPGSDVGALALAGVNLATHPDYYRDVAIRGRCLVRNGQDGIDLPCTHVDVILQDTAGHELSRTQVDSGEFAFRVAAKTPYRFRVASKRWKMDPPQTRDLYRGDDVVLHLVRQ